ncbi:Alpha/Beta hydrolase protein [Mortierella sp. GBAus27b]|nr:Alpha/Beta hydrolase protein [Mortierella sp. GBAus27b]
MISQIQAILRSKLSLADVFQTPTIAQLASLVSSGDSHEAAFNVLLPIKKHGSRAPLFCIHPGIGLSWDYMRLVKHLHAEQPVYGLQIRGFFDDDQPAATVDEMALDYIDQIQRIQPCGPYRLLGWSFGGVVAHTLASHLERQGERVVLLGIMDSFPFMTPIMIEVGAEVPREAHGPEFFWKLLHEGDDADDRMTEQEQAFWKRAPEVGPWVTRIWRNHSTPRYCGDMVLFRAMIQHDPRVPLVLASDWEPFVQGEIKVHDIHCKHDDMRDLEPMTEIGCVLEHRLRELSEQLSNLRLPSMTGARRYSVANATELYLGRSYSTPD